MLGVMRILVCVKQVPETDSPIRIDAGWIQTGFITEFRMNRLDEFAVEEAVLIKERLPATTIDAITVGPERCADVLRRAVGMGADRGIHITVDSDRFLSAADVAGWIGACIRDKNYDLIFTGVLSEDHMQGQIGPMLAAHLALPCATSVIYEAIASDQKSIRVEREIEGGNRDILELRLPAVITIQSGINRPRYPSLSNLLRANKQDLETISAGALEKFSASEAIVEVVYPQKSRAGIVLNGSADEKAARLFNILREKALM